MDIVSHALAGYAVGEYFGHPLIGTFAGMTPDICLGIKRRRKPSATYDFTHSIAFLLITSTVALVTLSYSVALTISFALLSHILLDIPTHGEKWAPPLLFPISRQRASLFGLEWEWFNLAWWRGLCFTFIWIFLWVHVIPLVIGSQ